MSSKLPGLNFIFLDDVLEYFGHERRDLDKDHNAYDDARLAATIYMEMMKRMDIKNPSLGFVRED